MKHVKYLRTDLRWYEPTRMKVTKEQYEMLKTLLKNVGWTSSIMKDSDVDWEKPQAIVNFYGGTNISVVEELTYKEESLEFNKFQFINRSSFEMRLLQEISEAEKSRRMWHAISLVSTTFDPEGIRRLDDNSVTNSETIRQIALWTIENQDNSLVCKIKSGMEFAGLYPHIHTPYDIKPDSPVFDAAYLEAMYFSEQKRGQLTQRVKDKSKELLGYEIGVRELRLMPYIMDTAMNNQKVDARSLTDEDISFLETYFEKGYITGSFEKIKLTKEFYDILTNILFLAYVDTNA